MDVAIVRLAPLTGGGIVRVCESWTDILIGGGHSVTSVVEASGADSPPPATERLRHAFYRAPSSKHRLGRVRARVVAACDLVEILHRERPFSLIISHNSFLSIELKRRLPRVPLLQTFHSPLVDENRLNNWKYSPSVFRTLTYPLTFWISSATERRALRSVTCAHTLSRYTWDRLRAMNPEETARLPWRLIPGTFNDEVFVPPGDRAAVRRRLGLDEKATILLTVRRLVPRNGVDRILSCAAALGDGGRPVRFLIGGSGVLKDGLERRAREQRLGDRVRFLGFIPEQDLAAYYQAADAFLLPTRDLECFGLPVVEAMACGCVPLITPDGGPAEICRDYPECIAAENTDDAFVDLVAGYLRGEVRLTPAEVASTARARYSETAVSPPVLRVVEDLARGTLDPLPA